jgi:SAM-dependent methyltransferase/uncharacterized protein YbaR (Trm112 family)
MRISYQFKVELKMIDSALLEILGCPACGHSLELNSDALICTECSDRYMVVGSIPLLILNSAEPTHKGWEAIANENSVLTGAPGRDLNDDEAPAFIEAMIVPTCGNLFRGWKLSDGYPISDFPKFPAGATILDIGCNWGRWTIAGAKAGYRVIGVDIHLQALLCAGWLADRLVPENKPSFVLGDARYLPFAVESFESVFSHSTIQHFSRRNTLIILDNISRVLKPGAKSVIQMPPNIGGIRARLAAMRGFDLREGSEFDVRWYSLGELTEIFSKHVGESSWSTDCFLGLNVHARDKEHIKGVRKLIIHTASILEFAAQQIPAIRHFSDSVFVTSTKNDLCQQ